jgi:hypothetical protein
MVSHCCDGQVGGSTESACAFLLVCLVLLINRQDPGEKTAVQMPRTAASPLRTGIGAWYFTTTISTSIGIFLKGRYLNIYLLNSKYLLIFLNAGISIH